MGLFNNKQPPQQSNEPSMRDIEFVISRARTNVLGTPSHPKTSEAIVNRYPGLQITKHEAYALLTVELAILMDMVVPNDENALSLLIICCRKAGNDINADRARNLWEVMRYFRECAEEYKEFFRDYLR